MKQFHTIAILLLASLSTIASADIDLIGGTEVNKNEFPEIVRISIGNSRCSAVIVGPRVVMTAAHCIEDSNEITQIDFSIQKTPFHAKCQQSPEWKDPNVYHDLALCKTDEEISDIHYATVSDKALQINDEVNLTGYGCTAADGNGGNDGILRMGSAKVTELPSPRIPWFQTIDQTVLCSGDSGGPALLKSEYSTTRYVVGINSMGDSINISFMTALWIDKSIVFMKNFETKNDVKICGVSANCDTL